MTGPVLPTVDQLTRGQYSGWNCVWCGTSLQRGGISAGVARGSLGAHCLDTEVYACPPCIALRRPQGDDQ